MLLLRVVVLLRRGKLIMLHHCEVTSWPKHIGSHIALLVLVLKTPVLTLVKPLISAIALGSSIDDDILVFITQHIFGELNPLHQHTLVHLLIE